MSARPKPRSERLKSTREQIAALAEAALKESDPAALQAALEKIAWLARIAKPEDRAHDA